MKLSSDHDYFNGLCCGCNAAIKQEDVDPNKLYMSWLCGRCRAELEHLPLRHQVVFDKLNEKIKKVIGEIEFLKRGMRVLEGFIRSNGLNPQNADDSYADK